MAYCVYPSVDSGAVAHFVALAAEPSAPGGPAMYLTLSVMGNGPPPAVTLTCGAGSSTPLYNQGATTFSFDGKNVDITYADAPATAPPTASARRFQIRFVLDPGTTLEMINRTVWSLSLAGGAGQTFAFVVADNEVESWHDVAIPLLNAKSATIADALSVGGSVEAGGYAVSTANVNAFSLEVGGPDPTTANGQATIFLHHHGRVAHQLRYANGTLSLERAGNGYGTTNTPSLSIGGAVNAGGYAVSTANVNASSLEVGGPDPTTANGQATIFLHHHGRVAHQLRYANGTLSLERAGNGYGTSDTPSLSVGGAVKAGGLRVTAGTLPAAGGSELSLASFGFRGDNEISLGVRAHRDHEPGPADGAGGWGSTAIVLGLDVDATREAGASIRLHGNGDLEIKGNFVNHSSREIKENIHALDGAQALAALKSLSPVTFSLKMDPGKSRQAGFIAEEVPPLVGTAARNAIRPVNIIAVLTRIVQMQQETIERLERRVESMHGGTQS